MVEKAIFGAGCFWGIEAEFAKIPGVLETAVGYSGGTTENPSYKDVCTDTTGHAEVVEIVFDPHVISYETLLQAFFQAHNPTTRNRQGPDVGSQYRSVIFYFSKEQAEKAIAIKERLGKSDRFKNKIVTEILPARKFYRAEEYHQKYFQKNGGGSCHI